MTYLILLFVLSVLVGAVWLAFDIRKLKVERSKLCGKLADTESHRDEWCEEYRKARNEADSNHAYLEVSKTRVENQRTEIRNLSESIKELRTTEIAARSTINSLHSIIDHSKSEVNRLKRLSEMTTVNSFEDEYDRMKRDYTNVCAQLATFKDKQPKRDARGCFIKK